MSKQFAFIDEYGESNLNTEVEGASTHFIIVATLINNDAIPDVYSKLEIIRSKHFQTGEIKSSTIGSNDQRRIEILTELSDLDFKYYAFIIDKRKIFKDSGLIYKKPFIKFLHGIVYNKLFRAFPDIRVIADEHGTKIFMEGFRSYVEEYHIPDLFMKQDFSFSTTRTYPALGISDFIAGTLARIFDPKKTSFDSNRFLDILNDDKIRILIEEWPPSMRSYKLKTEVHNESLDQLVCEQAHYSAVEFLETYEDSSDEDVIAQIETVKYMLFYKAYIDPSRYISTGEFKGQLTKSLNREISDQYFRTSVIAKLRDKGVLIASGNKGYKIPVIVSDLIDYIEHSHRMIGPMINRIKTADERLLLASKGTLDLLGHSDYAYIRQLINNLRSHIVVDNQIDEEI